MRLTLFEQNVQIRLPGIGIEGRCRLVGYKKLGRTQESPSGGHALLLAHRKFGDGLASEVLEPEGLAEAPNLFLNAG